MTSINMLTNRVARLRTALQEPHRTIIVIHPVGSNRYTLSQDGTTCDRTGLDKLLATGHSLVIREIPSEWITL